MSTSSRWDGPPPASGAWRPGDPPGRRQFAPLATGRPLALEGGGLLRDVTVAYETWGTLADDGANAVLVCHALSGDSHAAGLAGPGHPTPGWWEGLIGPGLGLDTDRWFVVCANVLGGCQGSTGPASENPATGKPYGSQFPVVTIRDMVRVQQILGRRLGVRRWLSVIGGSMGGMQVLEWAVTFPDQVASIVPVATTAQHSALQIALGAVGRHAIRVDPGWRGGDYYDAAPGEGPHRGLAVARELAQITYRSDGVFQSRFGRDLADLADGFDLWQRFEVERYLEYHGEKLARRFDANSYLVITKAMDLHDVGRGRGGLEGAMARIRVPTLTFGIRSDTLYPIHQQHQIRDLVAANGVRSEFVEIDSEHGHDAFLIDLDQVAPPLAAFLDRVHDETPR